MRSICTLNNFKKAIFNTERVVSKQGSLPILNNILIEAKKGFLKFSATNLEIGVVVKIGAKIEKEGGITIPAKILSSFINNLPKGSDNLELEIKDQSLFINTIHSKSIIKGLPISDFPLIPEKNGEKVFSVKNSILREVINRVLISVSLGDARPELTGVNLILDKNEIFLASTDSFRLTEMVIPEKGIKKEDVLYEALIQKNNTFIIPAGTLIEVVRMIQGEDEEDWMDIILEDGQVFFETGGGRLVSRLINGKYPEYKHIMPQSYQTRVVLDRELAISLVKVASIFGNNKNLELTVRLDDKVKIIIFEGKNIEMGENISQTGVDMVGPGLEVVINAKYFLDGLNNISTQKVALLFNNNSSPVGMKNISEKKGEVLGGYVYIVMPIKSV